MDINFSYSANFFKSGKESDKKIPVTIIPNAPTKDRVNDTIHLKAFRDKSCREDFLKDGILDYDHQSVRGKTVLEKSQSVIGQPTDLYVDEERGVPVCDGFLFRGNPYVDNAILPALESDSTVFGASVGGKILKSVLKDITRKSTGKDIYQIKLKHIAICPLQNAVHGGTLITLKKSQETDGEDYEKELTFKSPDHLFKSLDQYEELEKALTAGSATNIAGLSGGQAIQGQSLEGSTAKLVLPFFLESIVNGNVDNNRFAYKSYLKRKGLNSKIADDLIILVAKNVHKIARKVL